MAVSKTERVSQFTTCFVLSLVTLCFVIPFVSIIGTSLISPEEAATRGQFIFIPYRPALNAYQMLLGHGSIVLGAYKVTVLRTVIGTTLCLFFTFSLAYVLARRSLFGRQMLTSIIFFTMIFSGGLIPRFILVEKLGLIDSFWSMVLPVLINPWWLFIMRNYIMMSIPEELEEAAIIDGASPPTVLARIVFPLAMPAIATFGLWYAVSHWNAWFDAIIYINTPTRLPVQAILRDILIIGTGTQSDHSAFALLESRRVPPPQSLQAAMIVVCTLPILLVYPFIQPYFVKGMMVGAIKG